MVRDLYYKPRGAQLYNVHFKDGSLANRVTQNVPSASGSPKALQAEFRALATRPPS